MVVIALMASLATDVNAVPRVLTTVVASCDFLLLSSKASGPFEYTHAEPDQPDNCGNYSTGCKALQPNETKVGGYHKHLNNSLNANQPTMQPAAAIMTPSSN